MKSIKKISIFLAIVLIISISFSISALAHDDIKEIEENDKVYTTVPWEYELSVFGDDLAYSHENGNYIEFCVDENKFAPEGITALDEGQIKKVFEHYYLNEGELENLDDYAVIYDKVEKTSANGYNCYYLTGKYAFTEEEIDTDFAYFFHAAVFATKEDIFTVVFESYEKITRFYDTDLPGRLGGMVLNGTLFEGDKPENNADHDFSASPAYDEVVSAAQGALFEDVFADEGMMPMIIAMIVLLTIVPTVVLVVIAVVLIVKYSKNKKKLKRYELTYGAVPKYNAYQQNYGGYGYNPTVNQPYQQYQPPINPVYQQNPVNQNIPQTPSYVTNAVNNLENTQPTQPAQPNLPPELQDNKIDNENKF